MLGSIILTLGFLEGLIRWKEKILPPQSYQQPLSIYEIANEVSLQKRVKNLDISAKTFNIYYFGESTMWGEPYQNTIPIMVEKMLGKKVNGKDLKWINLGEPGIDYTETERRIKMVVDQKNIYFPSLVLIYSGHNEFLYYQDDIGFSMAANDKNILGWLVSRSRLLYKVAQVFKLYKLQIDDRAFFDVPVVNKDKYKEILSNYENKIQSTISYLRNNEVPVVISTVAGNYADFEPNRSVFTGDESKKAEFKNDFDLGLVAEKNGKLSEAAENYQKALKIDGNFAEVNFRLGKIYQKLGQNQNAGEYIMKAVDNDMMPMRAVSLQNDFIRGINEDNNTGVIDTVNYLKQNSSDGLLGNNFFADAQHPNLEGYRLISELFAQKIVAMYPEGTKFTDLSKIEAENIFNANDGLYNLDISRADWMIRLASWRYDPTQRLAVAEDYLNKAYAIHQNDYYWYLCQMTLSYLKKDTKKAQEYFKMAEKISTGKTYAYVREYWVNQVITRALNSK